MSADRRGSCTNWLAPTIGDTGTGLAAAGSTTNSRVVVPAVPCALVNAIRIDCEPPPDGVQASGTTSSNSDRPVASSFAVKPAPLGVTIHRSRYEPVAAAAVKNRLPPASTSCRGEANVRGVPDTVAVTFRVPVSVPSVR